MELAIDLGLPVVVHNRESNEEMLSVVREEAFRDLQADFHSFAGGLEMGKELIERGFYLGLSGMITFPKADNVREVIPILPPDRALVETDTPYLAPVPYRGKPNRPAYVRGDRRPTRPGDGRDFRRDLPPDGRELLQVVCQDPRNPLMRPPRAPIGTSHRVDVTSQSDFVTSQSQLRDFTMRRCDLGVSRAQDVDRGVCQFRTPIRVSNSLLVIRPMPAPSPRTAAPSSPSLSARRHTPA